MTSDALPPLDANEASANMTISLSTRYECPLCFDVLRRPILLPCCKRHLCLFMDIDLLMLACACVFRGTDSTECFERALELTSVNCGFCRKRIVGFARKKQYKVDNALWNEILAKCPFIGASLISSTTGSISIEEPSWTVEFVDEQAAPRHASHPESQELKPGELKQMYEQRVREHQSQLEQQEALALEKTMDFLQSDPDGVYQSTSYSKPDSTGQEDKAATKNSATQRQGVRTSEAAASRHVLLLFNGVIRQGSGDTRFNRFPVALKTSKQTLEVRPQPRLRASSQRLAQSATTQARSDPDHFVPVIIVVAPQHSSQWRLHFENHSVREMEVVTNRKTKVCRETESPDTVEMLAVYIREHVL